MIEVNWEKLPNLQLIGERFCSNIFENINKKKGYPEFELLGVFYQSWSNPLGLKLDEEEVTSREGEVYTYYTTVMYERLTDTYGIFQNNEFAYLVEGSSNRLLIDIDNGDIQCLKVAKYRYSNRGD